MVLEFYYDIKSQPCRAVYFLLKLAKVDFEAHIVDLIAGQQMKPEFLKLNPLHKLPFIKDGDFTLSESVAIMRYIAVKYDLAEHWYPRTDVQKQARVDEFLNWHHTGLRKPCLELYLTTIRMKVHVNDHFSKIPFDAEKLKALEDPVKKSIKDLDEYFLRGKPYIVGDEMSAADLIGFCEIMTLDTLEGSACAACIRSNDNVNKWLERVEANVASCNEEPSAAMDGLRQMFVNAK